MQQQYPTSLEIKIMFRLELLFCWLGIDNAGAEEQGDGQLNAQPCKQAPKVQ